DSLPRPAAAPSKPPEEEAKDEVERFRAGLSRVWKQARTAKRADLESRLAEIAKPASNFTQKLKGQPGAVLRGSRKLPGEIDKIQSQLDNPQGPPGVDGSGLLEGSS